MKSFKRHLEEAKLFSLADFPPTARSAIEKKVGKDVEIERFFYGADLRRILHHPTHRNDGVAISSNGNPKNVFMVMNGMDYTVTGPVPPKLAAHPKWKSSSSPGTSFTEAMDAVFGQDGWTFFLVKRIR